jgi:hypothetical protein
MSIRTMVFVGAALCVSLVSAAEIAFDLPSSIECREVTPEGFAEAHSMLKVIEARFRISARVTEGSMADVVDFYYELTSHDNRLRFQDYLPSTMLESAVADDVIEITNSNENAKNAGAEAHVAYKIFTVGASASQATKKAECSHYKQIAAKDLVLASGTIHREHGVFFRLRPSRAASLEGAKEFTFLATVPKSWRGDLCTISCTARAKKSTFLSSSVANGGAVTAQIGLFLVGDPEAASLAEAIWLAQENVATLAAAHTPKPSVFDTISSQTVSLFTGKKTDAERRRERAEAEQAVLEAQKRLAELSR